MENRNKKLISALYDLVKINNDRIEGYKKAIEISDNAQVKPIFHDLALHSSKNIDELTDRIFYLNGKKIPGHTTFGGQIYRGWMNLKATISGNDEHTLLADCEHLEDVTLKSYQKIAMNRKDYELDLETYQLLNKEMERIISDHDKIKKMRDTIS